MSDALARVTDPSTSHAAAESIAGALPKLESVVLQALRAAPNGATSTELAQALDLSLVTVSPRLRPLANRGLIVATAFRRKGPSGRPQIVWAVSREPRQESLPL